MAASGPPVSASPCIPASVCVTDNTHWHRRSRTTRCRLEGHFRGSWPHCENMDYVCCSSDTVYSVQILPGGCSPGFAVAGLRCGLRAASWPPLPQGRSATRSPPASAVGRPGRWQRAARPPRLLAARAAPQPARWSVLQQGPERVFMCTVGQGCRTSVPVLRICRPCERTACTGRGFGLMP